MDSAESAANDGLAYPFLSISIYLAVESSKQVALGKWFLVGWLCEPGISFRFCSYFLKSDTGKDQVIMGTTLGAIIGQSSSMLLQHL